MLLNDCERVVTILKTMFIVKTHYIDFDLEIPIEVCTDRFISHVLLRSMGTCQVMWRSKGPKNNGHGFDQEKALCFGLYQSKMDKKDPTGKFRTWFSISNSHRSFISS